MDQATFTLLDVSGFPIVRLDLEGRSGSHAAIWVREMEALLGHGRPFVLLVIGHHGDESPDDKKTKTVWLKTNREALVSVCRGFVSVEPDAERRAALAAQGAQISKSFGLALSVAATVEEAEGLARTLLGA